MLRQCLAAIFVSLVPLSAWAEVVVPSERVVSGLNVRKLPDTDSQPVASMSPGDTAELLERVPLWYRVRLQDGTEGFVSKAWSAVLAAPAPPDITAVRTKQPEELRIHFFNIGGGTCTVVECPGEDARPMIVDCGSKGGSRKGTDISNDDLKSRVQGILANYTQAPDLVFSHGDEDHYNLIETVLEGVTVNQIWHGDKASSYNEVKGWMEGQKTAGAKIHRDFPAGWHNDGEEITEGLQCGTAQAYVLTVNVGDPPNRRSLVLMLEYEDFTAIMTGDAEGPTEASAIENFEGNLKATVLTGSHHGANTQGSNSSAWAAAVAPEIVIYSAGAMFGHPRCLAVERLDDTIATVPRHKSTCGTSNDDWTTSFSELADYTTSAVGAVTITTDGTSPLRLNCEVGPGCGADIPF